MNEVVEWEWDSNPEPHLINKIIRCEEGDMYEMYSQSQNGSGFKIRFYIIKV